MTTKTKTIRVAAYLRVSTPGQAAEDKVSLGEQREDIEKYCALRGYEIVVWYSDVGSGDSKHRKDFQRMLRDAEAGLFDIILCWRSDRLSRGMFPAAALMEAIENTPIELESVTDTIDKSTFELFAWVGKRSLEAIRERARMGARGKAKSGAMIGNAKYGYSLEGEPGKKRPVINEAEAAIVRRIFSEYVGGKGCRKIATDLQRDGIPTRFARIWASSQVVKIIAASLYTGKGFYGKKTFYKKSDGTKNVRHYKATDPDQWIEVSYPPIISQAEWDKAQVLRAHPMRNATQKRYDAVFMLKGLAICGDCGRRLSTEAYARHDYYKRKDGTVIRKKTPGAFTMRYRCLKASQEASGCSVKTIGANSLDRKVWTKVCEFLGNPDFIEDIISDRKRSMEESGTLPELDKARKQLESIKAKETRALDLYLDGMVDKDYLTLKVKEAKDLREYYEGEVARLEREAETVNHSI